MGTSQNKQNKRTSTISSRTRTISTAMTNESRVFRFTEDKVLSLSRTFSSTNYLNRIPQPIIDQISLFLTISDLVNLQCTNRAICETFYNSLPYSQNCGQLLYNQYDDQRLIIKQALRIKNAQWPHVMRSFVEAKNDSKHLPNDLKVILDQGFQKHIVYPPLLMDEVSREGLNSEFQRQIMQKLNFIPQCHSVSEIKLLNECRQYLKNYPETLLEIRTLSLYKSDEFPQLFKIIVIVFRQIYSLLQIVSLTLECACNIEDNVGFLAFYLYSWQLYCIWMQSLDQEITQYLNLVDVLLKEQYQKYLFPTFTIQWIMMYFWNQTIYIKVKHKLRMVFISTLLQLREYQQQQLENIKFVKYLLKDYVKLLVDLSTHQGNIKSAGHSTFKLCQDLEGIFEIVKEQEIQKDHFEKDLHLLNYVFQSHFSSRLVKHIVNQRIQIIKEDLRQLYNSEEYQRRINRISDNHLEETPQDYKFQLLNVDRVQNKIKQIINFQESTPQDIKLIICYEKQELDKNQLYLQIYNKELYDEIEKLVKLEITTQDNLIIKDDFINHRNIVNEFQDQLTPYSDIPDLHQLKQIIKQKQKKATKKQTPQIQQFKPFTLVAGLNLAQSLKEQYISQQ